LRAELGYKTVLWTIDTVDWQRPAPTVIIDRVLSKLSNGALVLMHPTQPTLEAPARHHWTILPIGASSV